MNQPLGLWRHCQSTRLNIGHVCSSCRVRSLLPVVQRHPASSRYWATAESTRVKQARREKTKSKTEPGDRDARFQNSAEFREATERLRRYLFAGSMRGVFSIDPVAAMKLLSWMMDMGEKSNHEKFTTICENLSLDPSQVVVFARVLLKTRWHEFKKIGSTMITYAAEAGDPTAACFVVEWALEKKDFSRSVVQTSLRRVGELAEKDRIPQAMALQGMLCLRNGEIERAEKLLDEATKVGQSKSKHDKMERFLEGKTENHHSPSDPQSLHPGDMARYCRELAKIRAMNEDVDGAVEAYRRAAFEWDDPLSFSQLARLEEKYSAKWLECSIKAASGGDEESAYNLGMMYSMPRGDVLKSVKDKSVRNEIFYGPRATQWASTWSILLGSRDKSDLPRFHWATEWFQVANERSHLNSMWECSRLFWQIGLMGQTYACQHALLLLFRVGALRDESSERLPRLKQQAEQQIRAWVKTEQGKKALRELDQQGMSIPSGLKSFVTA